MTGPQRQIARPSRPTRAGLLALAVLTIVTLAFTARADGFVYCPWGPQQTFGFGPSGVGRANLDGTGVDRSTASRIGPDGSRYLARAVPDPLA